MNVVSLSIFDLFVAAFFVFVVAGLTLSLHLNLGRQILVAAMRTTVQLLSVGFLLKILFEHVHPLWLLLMALVMLLAAAREVMQRQQRRFRGVWGFSAGALSMLVSSFSLTLIALVVIIRNDPWYRPQYAIPLLGMMLGNTMNGIALGLDRLTSGAWQQRSIIENRLMLGQPWNEAIADIRRESMRNGMIPIINAMAIAGLVSLPGMMTGQILAGSPPLEAVKYQILIMFLISSGTGLGVMTAVSVGARRLFDNRDRLCLDRLQAAARG
ncbi:iron export ABC transporter permease subunit FetB [candidate division KSB1 bacterium]|nr:iron export ABC transporter permease subunit FetB [candidate division KSB1 bacterium]